MIGPVANSVCIVAGSILGALCGPVLSQEFRKKIMNVFSCITLGIGVTMLSKGDSLPPVVLSLLFGTALGELTRFESLVMKGAFKVAGLFKRNGKAKGGKSETLSETVFRDQFAVATVLFCVSGLGIIGSMREGLTGERSLLVIKGVLDLHHGHAHFGEHRQCGGRAGRSAVRHSVCLAVRWRRCSCRTPRRPCLRISPLAAASSCSARGCARWGSCRSLSSVCCPVCFSSWAAAVRIMGSGLCR